MILFILIGFMLCLEDQKNQDNIYILDSISCLTRESLVTIPKDNSYLLSLYWNENTYTIYQNMQQISNGSIEKNNELIRCIEKDTNREIVLNRLDDYRCEIISTDIIDLNEKIFYMSSAEGYLKDETFVVQSILWDEKEIRSIVALTEEGLKFYYFDKGEIINTRFITEEDMRNSPQISNPPTVIESWK